MILNSRPGYRQEPGNGRITDGKIYVGIVKDNVDIQKMNRIRVWIPELGSDINDDAQWIICSYASPFAGATDPTLIKKNDDSYTSSQISWGMWFSPPPINGEVLVCFAGGELSRAFYFSQIFGQYSNHMIPGIPADTTVAGQEGISPITIAPVVEYNKKNDNVNPPEPPRPRFEPLHQSLLNSGLYTDSERGITDSGARRESPSQVNGILTQNSHQFVIDDSNASGGFRLRTRNGSQVLIHDGGSYIYIQSGQGNSWVEISDEGINMYTSQKLNIRCEDDLNIRTDSDFNLDVGGDYNILVNGNKTENVYGNSDKYIQGNEHIQTDGTFDETVTGNVHTTYSGTLDTTVTGAIHQSYGATLDTTITGAVHTNINSTLDETVTGAVKRNFGATVDQTTAGNMHDTVQGTRDELTTGTVTESSGGQWFRTASTIHDNSGNTAASAAAPTNATIAVVATDATVPDTQDIPDRDSSTTDYPSTTLSSIVSQLPHHEPWAGHPHYAGPTTSQTSSHDVVPTYSGTQTRTYSHGNGNTTTINLGNPKKGSTRTDATKPANVVGSPHPGDKFGYYVGTGYDSNGNPQYNYIGPINNQMHDPKTLTIDQVGLDFIANEEGKALKLYSDVGHPAIGYGHDLTQSELTSGFLTINGSPVPYANGITKEQAVDLLKQDTASFGSNVSNNVSVLLSQSQFNALCSFCYNIGKGAFNKSTLLSQLNQGSYSSVPTEMSKWCHANGSVFPPLQARREREAALFTQVPPSDFSSEVGDDT